MSFSSSLSPSRTDVAGRLAVALAAVVIGSVIAPGRLPGM